MPQPSLVESAAQAIQSGRVDALKRLLREHPDLASARIGPRTLLHVATDWPGHFPQAPDAIAALIEAGADANARFDGSHAETPLHWAASTDDIGALDALLARGADIEAPGSVIGGGTALADAVAFGQWQAARRLVERGARATLWQAAALGLLDRIERFFAEPPGPAGAETTNAFWCACHGGQRRAAEYLLARGAYLNWIGYDNLTPLDAARRSGADDVVEWLVHQGARPAADKE
jgi:ankyrin repeat protein